MIEAPWRPTWQALDPLRVCYTCGRPPDDTFRDGSPKYICTHPPITDDLEQPDWAAYAHDMELDLAEVVADAWADDNEGKPRRSKWKPDTHGEGQLDVDARGITAQLVASRLTGLTHHGAALLPPRYRRKDKTSDIGARTEVRNAWRHDGPLYVYDNDRAEHLALLVTGHGRGPYVMRGWSEVPEAKVPAWWDESRELHRWTLPQSALRPLPLPAGA